MLRFSHVALPLVGSLTALAAAQDVRPPQQPLPQVPDVKTVAAPTPDPTASDLADLAYRAQFQDGPKAAPAKDLAPVGLTHVRTAVEYDLAADGVLWARGDAYKASFGADGATYIPFLGPRAPRNFPVQFQLTQVRLGNGDLALLHAPAATRQADTVTLDHGLLDEVYHLALDGMEQTFVLERPAGAGDLVLDLAVTTELQAVEAGDGFDFVGEHGSVHYGAATAVDAAGEQLPLTTEWTGSGLRITVPASFVASASYPLVVDPVVNTFVLDTFSDDLVNPDVCWIESSNVFYAVYEEIFSGSDFDIYSFAFNDAGVFQGGGYVNLTSEDSNAPAVACSPDTDACLVVWSHLATGGTNRAIVGRTYTQGVGFGTQFDVSAAAGGSIGDKLNPAVGADSIDDFMVVWERVFSVGTDHDIHGCLVDEATLAVGATIFIDNSGGTYDRRPDISKTNGYENIGIARWAVGFERFDGANYAVMVSVYNYNGTQIHAPFSIESSTLPLQNVRVSSPGSGVGEREYMVAYEKDYTTDIDSRAEYVVGNASVGSYTLNTGTILDDEILSGIDSNGTHFVAAIGEGTVASQLADLRCITLIPTPVGILPSVEGWANVATGGFTMVGDIACKQTYPSPVLYDAELFGIVHQTWDGTNWDMAGAIYNRYYTPLGLGYGTTEANSTGEAAKSFIIGSGVAGQFHNLYCTDLPANQFGYFLCSQSNSIVLHPGGAQGAICVSGNIGRFNLQVQNSGAEGRFVILADTANLPVNPPVSALPGQTWYFQAWYRDLNPTTTSNFSMPVQLTFN